MPCTFNNASSNKRSEPCFISGGIRRRSTKPTFCSTEHYRRNRNTWLLRKELQAVAFDEEFAEVSGLPVEPLFLLLLGLSALSIVTLIRVVGIRVGDPSG